MRPRQDRSGFSPLHRAAKCGSIAAAGALLEAGADIDEPALYDAATPLLLGAAESQEGVSRLLFYLKFVHWN